MKPSPERTARRLACALLAASLPLAAAAGPFQADVWTDNWFSLHVGERFVGEDSVSITTERSFNAETLRFEANYPLVLNFVIKDFKQNDTGLEYIGTPRQQIGDGGFIMQITDLATKKIVAVSSSAFKCTVLHKAPLNPGCVSDSHPTVASCGAMITEEPATWKAPGFDTRQWQNATVYSEADIGVKDGYRTISWDPSARLIWTSDLKADNTLLCKLTVVGP